MTASEVVAYIGAAAWVPQVGQWVYAWTKRPKLKLVSAGTVQVGYSGFGPIVTLTTAISCERRDALIKEVRLKATHEKGEERQLTWVWLKESQLQMSTPTGEMVEFGKNQPALALKVSTVSLVEKLITFTDPEFSVASAQVTDTMLRHYDYLKTTAPNPEDSLMNSREFMDAREFLVKSFYWKEGRYTFEVELDVVGVSSPHRERFSAVLKEADIHILQGNFGLFESYVRALLRSQSQAQVQWPQWKWANPGITPFR